MTADRARSNPIRSPHIKADQLILFADNQLSPQETILIEDHLRECSRCQTRLKNIQKTVLAYTDAHRHIYSEKLIPPPNEWSTFQQKLKRCLDEEDEDLPSQVPGQG